VRSVGAWNRKYLWEMKYTAKKQITVKADDLESVRKVAWEEGRIPLMGLQIAGRNYVVMSEDDFLELSGIDGG
jgi:Holliday junction resolvase